MSENIQKLIVAPVDGSENALKSLDYINLLLGPDHNIKTALFHVLPRLPLALIEERMKIRKILKQLEDLEIRHTEMAQRFLKTAKERLADMGFAKKKVETAFQKVEVGIARDIVHWSEKKKADAIFIATRGRSHVEAFFMGETAVKVLDNCRVCPVWIVKGAVEERNVLLAIDNSENFIRIVDHAGFMLSGTDVKLTIFHSKRNLRRYISQAVIDEFPEIEKYCRRRAGEKIAPFIQKAKEILIAAGLGEDQVTIKVVNGSRNAAADILKEAQNSEAGTILLGLHGYSGGKDFKMGGITRRVLSLAKNMTVGIVP